MKLLSTFALATILGAVVPSVDATLTCSVIMLEDNGCGEAEVAQMEDVITSVIEQYTEPSVIVDFDAPAPSDRRLPNNICKNTSYCMNNPYVCYVAGCANCSPSCCGCGGRNLQENFDASEMSIVGTQLLREIATDNPACHPRELMLRCDFLE